MLRKLYVSMKLTFRLWLDHNLKISTIKFKQNSINKKGLFYCLNFFKK